MVKNITHSLPLKKYHYHHNCKKLLHEKILAEKILAA